MDLLGVRCRGCGLSGGAVMAPIWKESLHCIATSGGPAWKGGFVHAGLGMRKTSHNCWSLTHIGTGHLVVYIHAPMAYAFDIATQIADLTDWDFDSLFGWRNRCPDLPFRIADIANDHPKGVIVRPQTRTGTENAARCVVDARDAAAGVVR